MTTPTTTERRPTARLISIALLVGGFACAIAALTRHDFLVANVGDASRVEIGVSAVCVLRPLHADDDDDDGGSSRTRICVPLSREDQARTTTTTTTPSGAGYSPMTPTPQAAICESRGNATANALRSLGLSTAGEIQDDLGAIASQLCGALTLWVIFCTVASCGHAGLATGLRVVTLGWSPNTRLLRWLDSMTTWLGAIAAIAAGSTVLFWVGIVHHGRFGPGSGVWLQLVCAVLCALGAAIVPLESCRARRPRAIDVVDDPDYIKLQTPRVSCDSSATDPTTPMSRV